MANPRLCSIPGCCKPARSRGWCGSHYVQWQRTGDPIPTRQHPYRRKKPAKTATLIDEVAMKHQSDECLKWPFALRARYPAAYYAGRQCDGHRLVCELSHGAPPTDRHQAAHSCGNRWCVNPRHLSWKVQRENDLDKIEHGTLPCGASHYKTFLTEDQVREIRNLAASTSYAEIGRKLGLNPGSVRDIASRKTWKWLE